MSNVRSLIAGWGYLLGYCLAIFSIRVGSFASGYFASLAPLSLATPFVGIGLALLVLIMAGALVYRLFAGKEILSKRAIPVAIALIFTAVCLQIPSQEVGFRHRMAQTSEAQWIALAGEARAAVATDARSSDIWHRKTVRDLAKTHPVLALGDWPPKLFVSKSMTSFYWGSGLVGTLGVDVLEPGHEPSPSVGYYRYFKLYPRVIVVAE